MELQWALIGCGIGMVIGAAVAVVVYVLLKIGEFGEMNGMD